jgi:hypothetical protein
MPQLARSLSVVADFSQETVKTVSPAQRAVGTSLKRGVNERHEIFERDLFLEPWDGKTSWN